MMSLATTLKITTGETEAQKKGKEDPTNFRTQNIRADGPVKGEVSFKQTTLPNRARFKPEDGSPTEAEPVTALTNSQLLGSHHRVLQVTDRRIVHKSDRSTYATFSREAQI